jgi:hypothetical protein
MPTLTHIQTLIIGVIVGPVLLVASAYVTRARGRQILGGAAGAAAYGLATFTWDRVAAIAGWWHYPFDPSATGQVLALELIAGVVAGGAFGLVGWRLTGRFGWRGLTGFLVVWSIWGAVHDLGGSALFADSNLMVFSRGLGPAVADVLNYTTCGAVAQLAIRLVAGPGAERPAAQPGHAERRARRPAPP